MPAVRATRPPASTTTTRLLGPLRAGRQQTLGLPLRHEREHADRLAGESRDGRHAEAARRAPAAKPLHRHGARSATRRSMNPELRYRVNPSVVAVGDAAAMDEGEQCRPQRRCPVRLLLAQPQLAKVRCYVGSASAAASAGTRVTTSALAVQPSWLQTQPRSECPGPSEPRALDLLGHVYGGRGPRGIGWLDGCCSGVDLGREISGTLLVQRYWRGDHPTPASMARKHCRVSEVIFFWPVATRPGRLWQPTRMGMPGDHRDRRCTGASGNGLIGRHR
jgi:hypothetical protein